MSEIEDTQQAADMLRLEYEVEQALQDAEDGLILTFDQIDTQRSRQKRVCSNEV